MNARQVSSSLAAALGLLAASVCGAPCNAATSPTPATQPCAVLSAGTPVCNGGPSGGQCSYNVTVTVTNNTGAPAPVHLTVIPTGTVSQIPGVVPPGQSITNTVQVHAQCGALITLVATLSPACVGRTMI